MEAQGIRVKLTADDAQAQIHENGGREVAVTYFQPFESLYKACWHDESGASWSYACVTLTPDGQVDVDFRYADPA